MKKILYLVTLVFILSSSVFGKEDIEKLKVLHENHEVKKHQTWQNWKDKEILQRISIAPTNIIEYIDMDNKIYGFDGVPKQIPIDSSLQKDLEDAIKELPVQITHLIQNNLIGIFILSGLGSTGYSEHIYKKGEYEGGFIILDQDVLLNIKANQWASWRVNSSFLQDKDYNLTLKIEEPSTNNRKQAIQFILIHEIAHIIGLWQKAHPRTSKGDPKKYPFSSLSWDTFTKSKYDNSFTNRKDIAFYSFKRAKLNIKDAKSLIQNLNNSNFCSVYGASSFFEDYAEAFTIFVHTKLMKKPYTLKLYHKDKLIEKFENPLDMESMKDKKLYFEELLK
jgi:hypothetical protein